MNIEKNSIYAKLRDVFVIPIQYQDIKDVLDQNRIVFITGTREYGKTYTAIRILWEFYMRGYDTKWFNVGNKSLENNFLGIRNYISPRTIILFDDPFGKLRYIENEPLERGIREILDTIQNTPDAYVIITSREDSWRDFILKSGFDPGNLEVRLGIDVPSYDYDKRMEILLNWAESENCVWLNNNAVKEIILNKLNDKTKLATPLNVKDFAYATKNMTAINDILDQLIEKSEGTPWSFAREIKSMTYDKILFLSFIFISNWFTLRFIEKYYNELAGSLELTDANDFNLNLHYFKDTKISVFLEYVRFLHDSYTDSLKYILTEGGHPTVVNKKIFGPVLHKLASVISAQDDIANLIAKHFEKFPLDIRNLLFSIRGEEDGELSILSQLIDSKNSDTPINSSSVDVLGKESLFIFRCIKEQYYIDKNKNKVIKNNLNWNVLWDYLTKLESEVQSNIMEIFLNAFSKLYDSTVVPTSFSSKLIDKIVDNEICLKVFKADKIGLGDIINHMLMRGELIQKTDIFGYKITEGLIKRRASHLQARNLVWKSRNGSLRDTAALKLRMSPTNKKTSHDKIIEYLEYGSFRLHLPEEVKEKANEITDWVKQNYLLAGRDPEVISAAIVTLACEEYRISIAKSKIIAQFHTNADAINQVSKIIRNILDRRDALS